MEAKRADAIKVPKLVVPKRASVNKSFLVHTENIDSGTVLYADKMWPVGQIGADGSATIRLTVSGERTIDIKYNDEWLSGRICVQKSSASEVTNIIVMQYSNMGDNDWSQLRKIGINEIKLMTFIRIVNGSWQKKESRHLTHYIRSVLDYGCLQVISPFSGKATNSISSHIISENLVAYEFLDCYRWYLISSSIGTGFAFGVIWIPTYNIIINTIDTPWNVQKEVVRTFEKLRKSREVASGVKWGASKRENARPVAVIGHDNYAHHLLNELQGLETIIKESRLNCLKALIIRYEPFGPLEDIFPELSSLKLIREQEWGRISESNEHVVNIGSEFISTSLRRRLLTYAMSITPKAMVCEWEEIRSKRFPIIWISVRSKNRTAINLEEFTVRLVDRLNKLFPRIAVVIDGFSYPNDFNVDSRYKRCKGLFEERCANDMQVAKRICEYLEKAVPSVPVYCCVGLRVTESIFLASLCDFYIAHHGTVQHKIGWTANKPGIVHSNSAVLNSRNTHLWVTKVVEDSAEVVYLPSKYVIDMDSQSFADARSASLRTGNYQFVDIAGAVEFISDIVRTRIAHGSGARI